MIDMNNEEIEQQKLQLEQDKLEFERSKLAAEQVVDPDAKDGLATASLVCGVLGFLAPPLSIVGLILGYCSKTPKGAKTGIIVSAVSLVLWGAFLILGLGLIGTTMFL
jgi:hypothetical protein